VKTIRRNAHRQIAAIRADVMHGYVYSMRNDFEPQPIVNWDYVWNQVAQGDAVLMDNEDGTYRVYVSVRLHYKLVGRVHLHNLGRAAYAAPNPIAAPAADGNLTKWFENMPVGTGAKEMMLEWQAGWNAAADEAAAAILAEEV
jgi:hypothetical protein